MARYSWSRSPVPWHKIREDYISGRWTLSQLAQKWRVKQGTISARSSRENWPSAAKIKSNLQIAAEMAHELTESEKEVLKVGLDRLVTNDSPGDLARAAHTDPSGYQKSVAEFATACVAAGMKGIKPPSNWKDLNTADQIARRAMGLDGKSGATAATLIRINNVPGGPAEIEVESQVMDDPGEGDDGV